MSTPHVQSTRRFAGGVSPRGRRTRGCDPDRLQRACLVIALVGGLALAACERAAGPSGALPVDPLCGPVAGARLPDDVRLVRVPGLAPLFESVPARRHAIAGHTRSAVTGLRVLPIFERVLEDVPASRQHVEAFHPGLRIALEPEVHFAPRARRTGAFDWTAVGSLIAASHPGDAVATDEVVFDLSALSPGDGAIEIGLNAYVTSRKRQHAWETAEIRIPEDAVLATGLGVLPAARSEGPIAWRLLACEGKACACVYAEVIDSADARLDDWQERRLSLASFAGRDVILRFETEALGEAAIDGGLWAEPVVRQRASEDSPRRTNLLLISLDTLGADHLGLYGHRRDTSPYIDRVLAPRGTVFMQAIAPATTTGPSHMTLFTSLPPSVHGAVSNLGGRPLPDPVPTLASTLRDAGYVTGAVTENGAITRSLGFDRGFDRYEENASVERVRAEGHIQSTFEEGRDFVIQQRNVPWFLFVHTYQVHHPYTPPAGYETLFEGDGLDAPDAAEIFSGGRRGHHPIEYDREIRFTDDRLRAFLSGLEADALLADTLVVVLADHGEEFLEHIYIGHGANLHRETVHVPLILVGPGVPAGLRIEQSVGLADVMPTLLELLHVKAPPGLLGRSLVPLLDAAGSAEGFASRPVFSEAWQTLAVARAGKVKLDQPTLSVRRGDFKLIRYREGEMRRHALFDLSRDSYEHEDLLADPQNPTPAAAAQLDSLAGLLDAYENDNAVRAAALGVRPAAVPDGEIDPDRIEKLRALGYIE